MRCVAATARVCGRSATCPAAAMRSREFQPDRDVLYDPYTRTRRAARTWWHAVRGNLIPPVLRFSAKAVTLLNSIRCRPECTDHGLSRNISRVEAARRIRQFNIRGDFTGKLDRAGSDAGSQR